MSYNGYTNYETWNCGLWLDNDQGTYEMVKEWAEDCHNVYELEVMLKDYVEGNNPVEDASMYSDLMQSAIDNINFRELAEGYWEEYHEEVEEEE